MRKPAAAPALESVETLPQVTASISPVKPIAKLNGRFFRLRKFDKFLWQIEAVDITDGIAGKVEIISKQDLPQVLYGKVEDAIYVSASAEHVKGKK